MQSDQKPVKKTTKKRPSKKSKKIYFDSVIGDIKKNYSGRNDSGVVFGDVSHRKKRKYGEDEADARFLRHLSNFFYWYVNERCTKGDAEVESMWVNDRLFISSNNPSTMKQAFEWMKKDEKLLNVFLSTLDADKRGSKMLDTFDSIYQSPNTKSDLVRTLQGISFEKIESVAKLIHIKKLAGAITEPSFAEKLVLVHGTNQHAEQKLMFGLVSSSLSKNKPVIIRGKKRPCYGCWIGLCFLSELCGYSKLKFNPFQGKAWVGSCRTLETLVKAAVPKVVSEEKVREWLKKKSVPKKTYVSFVGDSENAGYDSESDEEQSSY